MRTTTTKVADDEVVEAEKTLSPSLPWKTRLTVSLISTLTDASRRPNGTVNRSIFHYLDFKASPSPVPFNSVSSSDFTVDPTRNLWFRLFTPTVTDATTTTSFPVLVFFHGGGFTFLNAASKAYDLACRRFARKIPAYVISVNYRLAPEFRYPCQYDDGFDILSYLERNHRETLPENADLSRCFLGGDSAGANLAHNVAARACQARFGHMKVIGLLSIQPFFGCQERTQSERRMVSA